MPETILIVEDEPVQRKMIGLMLSKKLGYEVRAVENGRDALVAVEGSNVGEIGAVLLDINMPGMDGFETLKQIHKIRPGLPVVMLTAQDDASVAVKAIKEGASDFVVKPPDAAHLDVAIKNAIKISNLSKELALLKRDKAGALTFADLIGHKGGLLEAAALGRKAASSDVPVLITGETGVGKELFARAIHGESRRMGAPFVAINCGAIPENLVESTLFGHEKGAFTGAIARSIGKFREAEGGTIFLDEIGELPLEAQVKLLRILQQKEVEPVGAGKPVRVNVRVISATNRDLKADVKSGRFREDLYFRVSVLPIVVPPLRERRSDILPLAHHFIQRLSAADLLSPKPLTKEAERYLLEYGWPGNVRELENLIHRALVLGEGDEIGRAQLADIHDLDPESPPVGLPGASGLALALKNEAGEFKPMQEIEAEAMQAALAHYEGNITRAAEALGIAKSTFYRKIREA